MREGGTGLEAVEGPGLMNEWMTVCLCSLVKVAPVAVISDGCARGTTTAKNLLRN